MADATIIDSVFQGLDATRAAVSGAETIAQTAVTTWDTINGIVNRQQPDMFSRRSSDWASPMGGNNGFLQQQQQSIPYQPASYVWASQPSVYGGYGYNFQNNQNQGYPGISNPNYGKVGYFTGGYGEATVPSNGSSNWYDVWRR